MITIRKLRRKCCTSSSFLYQMALLVSILFLCHRSLRIYENEFRMSLPQVPNMGPPDIERHRRDQHETEAQYERVCFIRFKQSNRSNPNDFWTADGRRVVIHSKDASVEDTSEKVKKTEVINARHEPIGPLEANIKRENQQKENNSDHVRPIQDTNLQNNMVVVSVACKGVDSNGSLWQRKQLGVLMKSMVMLSRKPIIFYLFSDARMFFSAADQFINTWPKFYKRKFKVIKRDIWYPSDLLNMKTLFRPCSSQRLFLPSMLQAVDKAIYIDTDMLFLRPIDDLWEILETDISGDMFGGFAPRMLNVTDPGLPYYGKREVNAGLFLMNLQQLRKYPGEWQKVVQDIYQSPEMKVSLGRDPDDQDILNLMTTNYPHRFYNLSCEWNYRFFMCENASADKCPDAQTRGISLLHGLGHSFMNCTKAPKFCKAFQVAEEYRLRESLMEKFFRPIEEGLKHISLNHKKGYRCKMSAYFNEMLLKQIRNYVS